MKGLPVVHCPKKLLLWQDYSLNRLTNHVLSDVLH